MPAKNTRRRDWIGPNHTYNRAAPGRVLFRDDRDRDEFLEILVSRISRSKFRSKEYRRCAEILGTEVSSYCLMTTHFHLIVWQHEREALRRLMMSVLSTYVRYYNARYGTSGPLFSGPFKTKPITNAKQYRWTTAYVHANHPSGPEYRYSSHRAFVDDGRRPGWLAAERALAEFGGTHDYLRYMADHAVRAKLNRAFF